MLDYVKIWIRHTNIERLMRNPALDFTGKYSPVSGETDENQLTAIHHGCKITIFKRTEHQADNFDGVKFSGSLHKLKNALQEIYAPKQYSFGNGYNGNQFGYSEVLEVIEYLANLLCCRPDEMEIQNLEVGLNLDTAFDPKKIIDGLLHYGGTPFEISKHENYAQACFQRYILKIYNKSHQYGMPTHVLRAELKFRKMRDLNELGIYFLSDINEITLEKTLNFLHKKISQINYYDMTIRTCDLNEAQQDRLRDYSNPKFWMSLPANRRHLPKKELKYLISEKSDNLLAQVIIEIESKTALNLIQKQEKQ